tara:strand:- start:168 stop:1085 length:918 start_codon:yes stop_codon:yes gene_type:complete
MAVQFSLSYDDNGDPVLTENTVSGVRKVVSYAPVVSKYKPRFTSMEEESDEVENDTFKQVEKINENRLDSFIDEMESNAADDPNLSFIQKQNLERYTPAAIQRAVAGGSETAKQVAKTIFSYATNLPASAGAIVGGVVVKALDAILGEEDPEIKEMKEYYASDEISQLVESIPGMANYNLVSGGLFGSQVNVGYARAAQKRIDRINKTLLTKDSEVLRQRKKDLQELIDRENKERERIEKIDFAREDANPVVRLTPQEKDYFRGGGPDSGNQGGGGFDTSAADKAGTSAGSGQFSPSTSRGRSGY